MKHFLKPNVLLPALSGILIGLVLFILGENDDSPGLVFIGFISSIVLVFYGTYNAATGIKKGLIPAILCFFLCAFVVISTIISAVEGEFSDSPGIIIFAGLICIGLMTVGLRLWKNFRNSRS